MSTNFYTSSKTCDISELLGAVLVKIAVYSDESITFYAADGRKFVMRHFQDCLESVTLEDVTGDLDDLVGEPILLAEESTNEDNRPENVDESFTWTFYKLATRKGYVDLRWLGQSNGYYSERVDIEVFK